MLPAFAACTIYVIIRLIQGNAMSLSSYLNGVLWLGNNGINSHLEYIIDFFLGNVFIALLTYLFSNRKYFPLLYIPLMMLLYYMGKIWILATVIGGFTYHICEFIKEKKLYKYWYLLIVIPIVWWLPREEESTSAYSNMVYLRDTIACALIFTTFYGLPKLQSILNWNKLKEVKKISYSLFVTHGLVNILISGNIVEYFKNSGIIQNVYIVQLVTFLIVLAIDLILAWVLYYLVENKLYNAINNYLAKKVNNYKIELIEGEEDAK